MATNDAVSFNQLKKSVSNMKNYTDSKVPTINDSEKYILRNTITKNINFDDPDIITIDDKFKSVIKNLEITNESLSKEYISVKIQSDDGITFNKDITEYFIDGSKAIIIDKSTLDANGKAIYFILTVNRKAIKAENGTLTFETDNNYCTFLIRSLEMGKHPLNDYNRPKKWTVTLSYYDINSKYYKKMYNIPSNIEDGMSTDSIQQKGNTSTGIFALGSKNNGKGFLLGSSNTSENSSCVFGKGNACSGINPGYFLGEGNKSHGIGGGFTLGSGNNVEGVTVAIGRKLTTNEQKNGNAGAMIIGQGGTLSQDSRFMIATANTDCGDIRYPFDAKDNGDTYIRGKNIFLETEDEITNEKSIVNKKYVDDNMMVECIPILRMDETNKLISIDCNSMGTYKKYYIPNKYANIYSFSFIYTNSDNTETEIVRAGGVLSRDGFVICTRNTSTQLVLVIYEHDKYTYNKTNKSITKGLYGSLSIGNTTEFMPTSDYNPATKKYVDDVKASIVVPTKTSELTNDSNFLTEHQSLTGLATETYVNNKVAGIVNSAPETLDTLQELATALGNDANFATTVSTQIGKKVDKADGMSLTHNDLTNELKANYDAAYTYSQAKHSYNDLTDKPTIPSIDGLATEEYVQNAIASAGIGTGSDVATDDEVKTTINTILGGDYIE